MRVKNKKEKNEFREAINKHLKNSGESVVANKPLVDSIVEMKNNFRFKVLKTYDGGEIVTGVIHSTNEEGEVCPCVLGVIVNELTSDRDEDGKTISMEYLSESQVLDLIQNLTVAYRNLRSINMRLHDLSVCNPDGSYDD
ncbi:hypothetical protein [Segatella copri]|uniref:hypothetical protein n=1 Tax=Segatella copri TaxID=165179 RepID=UPI0022306724|nr:hypothetical protein [Segatella copri]MCW4101448.1 hypothetical protein [Segatella copri]